MGRRLSIGVILYFEKGYRRRQIRQRDSDLVSF